MRRLSILISVLALIALDMAFIPAGVAAQATPDAGKDRAVPADECQVEPRAVDEVFALLGPMEEALPRHARPCRRRLGPRLTRRRQQRRRQPPASGWPASTPTTISALPRSCPMPRSPGFRQRAGRRRSDRGGAGELGRDAGAAFGGGARPTRGRERRLSVGRRADRRIGRRQRAGAAAERAGDPVAHLHPGRGPLAD